MSVATGGPDGNERLTAATGVVLIALLAVEGVTIVFLRPLLSTHVFVGMLLIPPVVLKLASTCYRFVRYYTGSPDYRSKGPPQLLLRLLAPPVVVSTVVVFATGVALLVLGPGSGPVLGLHKASFVVWLAVTGAHVLGYVRRLPRLVAADWFRKKGFAGSGSRRMLVAVSLAAGVVLAATTLPLARPWLSRQQHRERERASAAASAERADQDSARDDQERADHEMPSDQLALAE